MDLDATLVVAMLVGGFVSIWLVVMAAVHVLRWARKNREEAAAMMTGTYLDQVAGGVIAPPDRDFTDWLGDVVDSFSEGPATDGADSTLGADHTLSSSTDGGSSPEGYSAQ